MTTFLQIVGGLAGLALLYYGAEFLVKGGVSLANKFKISPLVIGLTLVAFATSAPELVVSVDAAVKGAGNISIGNVVGSNTCNIALILGLCALVTPLHVNAKLFRLDVPLMIASALLLAIFYFFTHGINRPQALVFLAGIIAYTVWSVYHAKQEGKNNPELVKEIKEEIAPIRGYSVGVALLLVAGGLAALIGGAKLFVNAAVFLAQILAVSDAVIGLTIVAVGTSLPELATSLVASIRGEKDIAIGNVVGSNIFNILGILGIAPLVSPIYAPGIGWVDIGVMLFVTIILYPIMKSAMTISRKEGVFLLAAYVAYTVWLIIAG